MRGEWPLRSQEAYKHIEKEDPEFYLGLRLIATGKTLREKVYGCERIHDVLFEKNRT